MANATVFAQAAVFPSDVWVCVGHQIVAKKDLKSLTETCKAFRTLFTPILCSHQVIELHEYGVKHSLEEDLPAGFRYTKHIEFDLNELASIDGGDLDEDYNTDFNANYAQHIVKLVEAMPNLTSFSFRDDFYQMDNGPALILRDPALLNTLTAHKSLSNLAITFCARPEEDDFRFNSYMPILGFQNLTSLEIYNFHKREDEDAIKDLAKVLHVCPGLKKLGLGRELGELADDLGSEDGVSDTAEVTDSQIEKFRFIEKLCHEYSSMTAAPPLGLTTLRLGTSMLLLKTKSNGAQNYLSKLVNLSGLKVLHIWNSHINPHGTTTLVANGVALEHDWDILKGCTSLRYVEIKALDYYACEGINAIGATIEELVITGYGWRQSPDNVSNFSRLMLPNLAMLVVDERNYAYNFGQEKCSVLDHLQDHGHSLKRLAIGLDFNAQWEEFSSRLQAMPNLTSLSIQRRGGSLWLGGGSVTEQANVAYSYAGLAKWKCPSLQMVCIDIHAWQLTAEPGVELLSEDDIGNAIQFRPLDLDEMVSVDLFTYRDYASSAQAGLSDRPQISGLLMNLRDDDEDMEDDTDVNVDEDEDEDHDESEGDDDEED
ncbi:hypothetical protein BDZ45DRAFT_788483 [Acephala macrosclerotiorum]|nr:hypothetical protein BDZ45DRAFT_788483 [Acephala macrosclerotiorum]